jgi:hypothetical protein
MEVRSLNWDSVSKDGSEAAAVRWIEHQLLVLRCPHPLGKRYRKYEGCADETLSPFILSCSAVWRLVSPNVVLSHASAVVLKFSNSITPCIQSVQQFRPVLFMWASRPLHPSTVVACRSYRLLEGFHQRQKLDKRSPLYIALDFWVWAWVDTESPVRSVEVSSGSDRRPVWSRFGGTESVWQR